MVHILLLILKIIGIILGVLLAVLLIGLCIALFVPVRYQLEARRTEEEGAPPIEVKGSVTWLLHFVNVHFRYPADVYLRARIFLFTVFRLPLKQKSGESKNGERQENEEIGNGERQEEGRKSKSSERQEKGRKNKNSKRDAGVDESPDDEANKKDESPNSEENKEDNECLSGEGDKKKEESPGGKKNEENSSKPSIQEKIRSIFRRIQRIFQNIWYTLKGICDKIKTIRENIEYYMGVLKSDTFQNSLSLCKEELLSIFSYIKPRKFQADLTIGMEDPAATGKILSYYGMLYPLIGGHVNIVPDFERKRIEGAVLIKGKVRLFTFIKAAVRIYFSKDIRKLLRLFKKEDV